MEHVSSIAARAPMGDPRTEDGSRAARRQFRDELLHVASAYRHELVDETIRVYWLALKDIPVDIRAQALTRCLQRIRFFPTVHEILEACADVVDDIRRVHAERARQLQAACPRRQAGDCVSGYVENDRREMERCRCHRDAVAMMSQVASAIQRPALPAAPDQGEGA